MKRNRGIKRIEKWTGWKSSENCREEQGNWRRVARGGEIREGEPPPPTHTMRETDQRGRTLIRKVRERCRRESRKKVEKEGGGEGRQ